MHNIGVRITQAKHLYDMDKDKELDLVDMIKEGAPEYFHDKMAYNA